MKTRRKADSDKNEYTRTEKILFGVGTVLLLISIGSWAFDFSIVDFLRFGPKSPHKRTIIGSVTTLSGSVQRQSSESPQFTQIQNGTRLFLNDTIMTGPDSSAFVELSNGEKFEINPSSLVKLNFGDEFSFATAIGLKAPVKLNVLRGTTTPIEKKASATPRPTPKPTSTPKPTPSPTPSPTPVPTEPPIVMMNATPNDRTSYVLDGDDARQKEKRIPFEIKVNSPPQEATLSVRKKGADSALRIPLKILDKTLTVSHGFRAPGLYTWEVIDHKGRMLVRRTLEVEAKTPLIKTLPTEGSTNKLTGSATTQEFDGFRLRWTEVPGVGPYIVHIGHVGHTAAKKDLLRKEVERPEMVLNQRKLILNRLEFWVERSLGNGFVATSDRQEFGFSFLPPELKGPVNNRIITNLELNQTQGVIFFTWSKTNYTERYEFEVAKSARFGSDVVLRRTLMDNYFSWDAFKSGKYYWRVRSLAQGIWSDFSQPWTFEIKQ